MTEPAGRVAIVTGASRGLGQAIALRLAEEGTRVAAVARTAEPDPRRPGSLRDTVESIRSAGGEAVAIAGDLSQPSDRSRVVDETTATLGPIDILVNNAAVTILRPFPEFSEKHWSLMVEVQVRAPYDLAQRVVPGMMQRQAGWILNVSSRAAIHPPGPPFDPVHEGGFTVYGMVKAALDRFTTALAAEMHPHGVAANSLAPWDNVATLGAATHDLVEGYALEGPEWTAEAALALCSGDPKVLTGRVAYSQPLLAELQRRPAAATIHGDRGEKRT